jgi:hypothetical protein
MNKVAAVIVVNLAVGAQIMSAQRWEFGAVGGAGIYKSNTVESSAPAGSAGFEPGFAAGAVVGHDMYRHIGGEIRYLMAVNDLKVSSGSARATFAGRTHTIHYDVLFYLKPWDSAVRPYFAVGGGGRYYRGTGQETAHQPLSELVLLTKTREWRPLVSAAAGVKIRASDRLWIRTEFRSYVTPFPSKILQPGPHASLGGWMSNFLPLLGISYAF